ncbi:AAA family ATPase [Promicromonospora aerolata]|uniref:AAA family ATPase n=1 Tax=Promicromonospora aerolata TaxID=195749 RepID=A0ABW4V013_9MICO
MNYNERFKNADPTRFRDTLIEQTLAVLIGKTKSNALLIGAAGVGKTKIVEDIARRIELGDTLIPDQLKGHTVFELPISDLVAGSGIVGTLEAKVKDVVEYARNPRNKVVLFMDEIHLLVSGRDPSYSKIAQILKPALARGDLRVIGATTSQESRDLDNDPAFSRRFSRLVVDELTAPQTLEVLGTVRAGLVAHYQHQITVDDNVLKEVVRIADQNSRAGSHRPDNAITLLDRAMADRVLEQKRITTQAQAAGPNPVAQVLQATPNVPLTETRVLAVARRLLTGNAVKHTFDVQELEASLKQSIQGQDQVLDQLVDRLAREELNLFPRTTPIAWMFAGASGVGKTQTAKMVARHTTDQDPIILNMTEYNSPAAMARIIGSPAGYVGYDSNAELPFDTLESNPHRLILLDEFEKCDSSVQRLFLSALDEGSIKTSRGRAIDFSKAIIVATTNAARESLSGKTVGFGSEPTTISHQSLVKALADHFDAELLGRFSLVLGFNPISEATYREIVATDYAAERERILQVNTRLASALPAKMPDDELHALAETTYVDSQGARPARKAVRTWIEDRLLTAQAVSMPSPASDD